MINNDIVKITDNNDNDVYSWTISDSPYSRISIAKNNALLDNENFYYDSDGYYYLLNGSFKQFMLRDIDVILTKKFNYSLDEGDSIDIQTDENSISLKYPNSISLTLSIDGVTFKGIKLYTVYDSMGTQKYIYEVGDQSFSTNEALALYLRDTNNLTTTKESTFVLYRTDGSIYKTITTTNTLINDDGGSTSKKIKQVELIHGHWIVYEEEICETTYNFLEYHTSNQKYYYNKNYEGNRQVMELTDLLEVLTMLYTVTISEHDRILIRHSDDYSKKKLFNVVFDTGTTILYCDYNKNEHSTTRFSYNNNNNTFEYETFDITYTANELMLFLSAAIIYVYDGENIIATFKSTNTIVYYDNIGGKHTTIKYKYDNTTNVFKDMEIGITFTVDELMALLSTTTIRVYDEDENIIATFVIGDWKWVDLKYYTDDTNTAEISCLMKDSNIKLGWTSDLTYDVNKLPEMDFNEIFGIKRYYLKPLEIEGVTYDVSLTGSWIAVRYYTRGKCEYHTDSSRNFYIYDGITYNKTKEELIDCFIKSNDYVLGNGEEINLGGEYIPIVSTWVFCYLYTDTDLTNKINFGTDKDYTEGCIFNTGYNPKEPSVCVFHYRTSHEIFNSSSVGFTLNELHKNGYVVTDLNGNILFTPATLNLDD